jgi:hypothetical protein
LKHLTGPSPQSVKGLIMANRTKTLPRVDHKTLDAALAQATQANNEPDHRKRDALLLEACRLHRQAHEGCLTTEVERLQEAKRRALRIADERSRENVALRAENAKLQAALAEARR